MKKILQYVAAYLLLLPILAMGMWLFILGREASSALLRAYYVGESFNRSYQAGFYDRMFTRFLGLGWMALFVVAEELLRRSIRKGGMLRIFSRFMGILALIALVLDGTLLALLSATSVIGWARWLVLAGEFIFGALFVFLGWSERSPWYRKRKAVVLEKAPFVPDKSTHH